MSVTQDWSMLELHFPRQNHFWPGLNHCLPTSGPPVLGLLYISALGLPLQDW